MFAFEFSIGPAFVKYRNHPITIPKRCYADLSKEGLAGERQNVSIICPDGTEAAGHIYSSVANWGPFHQIIFDTRDNSPVKSLKIKDLISVEIAGRGQTGIITLRPHEAGQSHPSALSIVKAQEIGEAIDLETPPEEPGGETIQVRRIIRDTKISVEVKELYEYRCQLCGYRIEFDNGQTYAEAHHVKPLGSPHNGPDSRDNILCVCPNCHARLDFGAIGLDPEKIKTSATAHPIRKEYIEYHNTQIYREP